MRKNGCKFVVSVDCNPTRGHGTESTRLVDTIFASIRIMMKSNAVKGKLNSDICIEVDTSKYKSTSLENLKEMYEAGYEAGLKAVPKIKELFGETEKKKSSIINFFKRRKNKKLEERMKSTVEKDL